MQIKFTKTANTLIEVILVMTIMGVIAALTIPSLSKHSQRIEMAQMAKKAYFTLDGALSSTIANKSFDVDSWMPSTSASLLNDVFKPYLNIVKNCSSGTPVDPAKPNGSKTYTLSGGCFGEGSGSMYKFADQTQEELCKGGKNCAAMVLADGTGLLAKGTEIWVDVNAVGAPNKEGIDIFAFNIIKADSLCVASETGEYRVCPANDHTRSLMDEGWKVIYW